MQFSKNTISNTVQNRFNTNQRVKEGRGIIDEYEKSLEGVNKRKFSFKFINQFTFLFLILLFQIVLIFLVFSTYRMISEPVTRDLKIVSVLNNLSTLANIPPATLPNQVNIVGDGILPTIEDLKKIGPIQAEVFKDAKDGDYVLVYSGKDGAQDRLIIYRDSEKKLVYDGKTISAIDQENRTALLNKVVQATKNAGLISQSSTEIPTAQVVADSVKFKQENNLPFFQEVQNGDIIATYKTTSSGALTIISVSYTHLTLPTIYSV